MNRTQTSAYNNGYDTAVRYMKTVILPQQLRMARTRFALFGFSAGVVFSMIIQRVFS